MAEVSVKENSGQSASKMIKKCVMKGCEAGGEVVSLHRIPWKNNNLHNQWIQAIISSGTPVDKIISSSRVCSRHFTGKRGPNSVPVIVPGEFLVNQYYIPFINDKNICNIPCLKYTKRSYILFGLLV
jgi:hypothetical protein